VARGMRPSSEPASWPGVPCTATSYIVPALLIAAAKGGRDFIIAFENVSLLSAAAAAMTCRRWTLAAAAAEVCQP